MGFFAGTFCNDYMVAEDMYLVLCYLIPILNAPVDLEDNFKKSILRILGM